MAGAIETAISALDNAHLTNTYGSEATFGWLILPRHQLFTGTSEITSTDPPLVDAHLSNT